MTELLEATETRRIVLLSPEEAAKLDSIFEAEWGAVVPDPRHAQIVAEVEGDELVGFVTLEEVILVSNAYVSPRHRGTEGVAVIKRLAERVRQSASRSGRSFLMIGHSDRGQRYEHLFRMLGLRKIADALYRKDFFRFGGE
jgi:hypothetical protein